MHAFAAKAKAERQREELKQFIQYTMGQTAWDNLIKMEVQIRKIVKRLFTNKLREDELSWKLLV